MSRHVDCNAFGGLDGRGDEIWKRQSSKITEERIEMHRDRSEAACKCPFVEGDGDLERLPLTLLLRMELRMLNGDDLVNCAREVSVPGPEALR